MPCSRKLNETNRTHRHRLCGRRRADHVRDPSSRRGGRSPAAERRVARCRRKRRADRHARRRDAEGDRHRHDACHTGDAAPNVVKIDDVDATLRSIAPRVDPNLQGRSFFYLASGAKLSTGMNVVARIPTSRGVSRVIVPPDAVVSWQGRSWVYVRRAPTKFARIDASAIKAGDEVVTTGAQQLLSEEMRSQLHEA